jgi:hypothetical protein
VNMGFKVFAAVNIEDAEIVNFWVMSPCNLVGGFQRFGRSRRVRRQCVQCYHVHCVKIKVNLSLHRPWRPIGSREVEAPTFSDIRLIDGGKVVSPTRRPLFTPRKFPGTHFC